MKRHRLFAILGTFIAVAFIMFTPAAVNADSGESLVLDKYEVSFNYDNKDLSPAGFVTESYFYHYYLTVSVLKGDVIEVTSSNKDIVIPEYDNGFREIKLYSTNKLGTAYVYVKGADGTVKTITVNVSYKFTLSQSHLTVNCSYNDYYQIRDPQYDIPWPTYSVVSGYVDQTDDYFEDQNIITSKNMIMKVESFNKNIVTIDSSYGIEPVGVGTATIQCTDEYGQKASFKVSVTNVFVSSYIEKSINLFEEKYRNCLQGYTLPNSIVTTNVNGSVNSAKADANGYFYCSIPSKYGSVSVNYTIRANGGSYSGSTTVYEPEDDTIDVGIVVRNSKKMKVTIQDAEVGDTVFVKIGKKNYKGKIKKTTSSGRASCTIKIKKPKKAGTKIKMTLKDKSGRVVGQGEDIVYYAKKVKKGMTKKNCKLLPSWGSPDEVYVKSGKTLWYYDDGSYLLFKKNKVIGWHY